MSGWLLKIWDRGHCFTWPHPNPGHRFWKQKQKIHGLSLFLSCHGPWNHLELEKRGRGHVGRMYHKLISQGHTGVEGWTVSQRLFPALIPGEERMRQSWGLLDGRTERERPTPPTQLSCQQQLKPPFSSDSWPVNQASLARNIPAGMTVVLICWTPVSFLFLISLRLNDGLSACGPETLCTAALIKNQNPNLFSPEESLFPKMPLV